MTLALGILLCLLPFCLVFLWEDRQIGFLWVLAGSLAFDTTVAIVTESLGLFFYPIIFSLSALAAIVCAGFFLKRFFDEKKHPQKDLKRHSSASRKTFPILFLFAFIIIFIELWSVHYNYTGLVNTVNGPTYVQHSSYAYPLFSDEWTMASVAQYSIQSHSLPSVNPLAGNTPFPDFLIPIQSFVAFVFLILGLSPVAQYAVLAVGSGVLICLLVYFVLDSLGVQPLAALISILCVPLLANGSDLPGIWYFLPYTGGVIAFLIALAGFGFEDTKLGIFGVFLSFIFYPPTAVFSVPALAVYLAGKNSWRHLLYALVGLIAISVAVLTFFLLGPFSFSDIFRQIFQKISYINLDVGIIQYAIWNVLPGIVALIALACVYELFRTRRFFLAVPITVGLIYWICYAFTPWVFIITYPRIVSITSILLIISAGVGIDLVLSWLMRRYPSIFGGRFYELLGWVFIIWFAVLALSYQDSTSWETFVLATNYPTGTVVTQPVLPINRYLQPDDLSLFKGITSQYFTSLPWKGLVVGTATGNYPLETKPATITNEILQYQTFMAAECQDKNILANVYNIKYVYSSAFSCPSFVQLGISKENLHLYQYQQ